MKIPFGKYKGVDICFVNSGYLKWLIEQEWFFMKKEHEDFVVVVEKELEWRENTGAHFYQDKVET
jgi:uncharacterized protein (DUF3820 family)